MLDRSGAEVHAGAGGAARAPSDQAARREQAVLLADALAACRPTTAR